MMGLIQATNIDGGRDLTGLKIGAKFVVGGKEEIIYEFKKEEFKPNWYLIGLDPEVAEDGMRFVVDHRYFANEDMLKQGQLHQWGWLFSRELQVPKKGRFARLFMSDYEKSELDLCEEERERFEVYHQFLGGPS